MWHGDALANEVVRSRGAEVLARTYFFSDQPFVPLGHVDERPGADAPSWRFYLNDTVGAPDKVVDGTGEVVQDLKRRVWGRVPGAPDATPLRLPGQYEDTETGLHYNRFRYYDPDDVRFISPDPIGLQGDANLFAYVPNPLAWVDPLGWDWNYRLCDPSGVPYYHGRASDNETAGDIMSRHRHWPKPPKHPRMGENDTLQQVTPVGTDRASVRGVEDIGSKETLRTCKKDRRRTARGISDRKKDKTTKAGQLRTMRRLSRMRREPPGRRHRGGMPCSVSTVHRAANTDPPNPRCPRVIRDVRGEVLRHYTRLRGGRAKGRYEGATLDEYVCSAHPYRRRRRRPPSAPPRRRTRGPGQEKSKAKFAGRLDLREVDSRSWPRSTPASYIIVAGRPPRSSARAPAILTCHACRLRVVRPRARRSLVHCILRCQTDTTRRCRSRCPSRCCGSRSATMPPWRCCSRPCRRCS